MESEGDEVSVKKTVSPAQTVESEAVKAACGEAATNRLSLMDETQPAGEVTVSETTYSPGML